MPILAISNAKNNQRNDVHTISLFVANKPGVLVRCAQVFARRGFNIDALVVSPSANPKYSRMTITLSGDPATLDQIIKQTAKLVDVIHCSEHTRKDVRRKLKIALNYKGPVVIHCEVIKEDNVFPMSPAGKSAYEMIIEKPKTKMEKPTGST